MEISLERRVHVEKQKPNGDPAPLPHFLRLQENCLSEARARKQLIKLLKGWCKGTPKTGWDSATITFGREIKRTAKFQELLGEFRRTGMIAEIQRQLDRDDNIYGRMLDATSTPNSQLRIGSEWAGWSKQVTGPCRSSNVEVDLCEDILFYRRETCERSNESGFAASCRAYRGYLSACISIVEAFVARHARLAEHTGFSSPELDELKRTTNLDRRLELWWAFCVGTDVRKLTASVEWNHFQELRQRRNAILHAVDPIGVYEFREMQTFLNKVRTGVGGLLLKMREAHQKPTLAFIERLRMAPLVDFFSGVLSSDGQHELKVRKGRDK